MKRSIFVLIAVIIIASVVGSACIPSNSDNSGSSDSGSQSIDSRYSSASDDNNPYESIESGFESLKPSESDSLFESSSESTPEGEEDKESTDAKWFRFDLVDDGSGYSVSKCNEYNESTYPTKIVIPYTFNNKPVVSIGGVGFFDCHKLKSVTIPKSVTNILDAAFSNCENLENLEVSSENKVYCNVNNCIVKRAAKTLTAGCKNSVIPSDGSVTAIGDYAFYGSGLTEITIPGSVATIGKSAFSDCIKLEKIEVSAENKTYYSIDNCIIEKASRTLVTGCKNSIIPSDGSVTHIGYDAFGGCVGLTSVIIPNGVTSIGSYAFSDCNGLTSVAIPSSVTSIELGAFSGCSSLKGVTIPYGVTTIGDYAFGVSSNLTSVTIPDSVTTIGDYAFYGSGLTEITIPGSVATIGECVFYGCDKVEKIEVSAENKKYFSVDNCIIEKTSKTLLTGCKNSVIPSGGSVTTIGDFAFYGCSGLTSIEIPNNVTAIGEYAFSGCSGLTNIEIPNGVTTIGLYAFSGCSGLKSVKISDSVTSMDHGVFSGCKNIEKLEVSSGNKVYYSVNNCIVDRWKRLIMVCKTGVIPSDGSVTAIGDYAFELCDGLTDIEIPDGVVSIGNYAFSDCGDLTNIVIPDSVVSIGSGAFYGCGDLTNIVIPDSVVSIGSGAFYGCGNLTNMVIPDSVTNIGGSAFSNCNEKLFTEVGGIKYVDNWVVGVDNRAITSANIKSGTRGIACDVFNGCEGLTNVTISNGVKYIGDSAFSGCVSLTSVSIPNSVISIGVGAFCDCSSLKSVTIPYGVTSIGFVAFSGCSSLTSVTIPDSVTTIGDWAFDGCTSLTNINIPSSVVRVGISAFDNCNESLYKRDGGIIYVGNWAIGADNKQITSANIKKGMRGIADSAFRDCSYLASVIIPESVTNIGSRAFLGCSSLASIEIPNGVTSIEYQTFSGCSGLSSVTIPNSVTSIGYLAFSGCSSLASIEIPNSVVSIERDAFSSCNNLESVIFDGTMEQWKAIEKWSDLLYTKVKVIKCTDGEVSVDDK